MIFIGLLLCMVACLLAFLKWKYRITGKLTEGEIVGYERGSKGWFGFVGYAYRVRFEYEGMMYVATAIESVVGTEAAHPQKNFGNACQVYINPKSPRKRVSIKGFHQIYWLAFSLFILGALTMMLDLSMTYGVRF